MIVKLTYSAELEEVPNEVSKIVDGTVEEIEELARDLRVAQESLSHRKEPDVKSALAKLKFAMSSLEKLNAKMKDCDSILTGYLGVVEKQAEEKKPTETTKVAEVESKQQKQTAKKKAG